MMWLFPAAVTLIAAVTLAVAAAGQFGEDLDGHKATWPQIAADVLFMFCAGCGVVSGAREIVLWWVS